MKFLTSKDLLIILISLFIFQSCKKQDDILGLEDATNRSGLGGVFNNTTTFQTFAAKEDSLIASNFVRNLVGEMTDPVFGKTNASLAFQPILSKNNVSFGTNPILDSIVLVMGYINDETQRYYGDTSSVFNIEAFRLDEEISNDSIYYTNRKFRYQPTAIGTKTYKINYKDSLVIQHIIPNGPDTVQKVRPQLRIRLNDTFGQEILSKSGSLELTDNTEFLKYLKGIYLKATRVSGNGGIMSFDLSNNNLSSMIIYYKSGTDTSNFIFNVNSTSANVNNYEHDYTGSQVKAQLDDSTANPEVIYVQALTGIRSKIRFTNLSSLLDSGMIAVNKAELIVKVEPGSDADYAPAAVLALKRRSSTGAETFITTATLNGTKKEYLFDMTITIQKLIENKLDVADLFIEDYNRQIRPNRTILSGTGSAANPIKLNLVYTKLY